MAAYAAVVSLMNTLNSIQIHPRVSTFFEEKQIQSLHKIIDFLLDFIESSTSQGCSKEEDVLESHIASAAHAAEDLIESHVVDQILTVSTGDQGETSWGHVLDLEAVIKGMKSVQEKVMEFEEAKGCTDLQPSFTTLTTSFKPLTTAKNVMVGFDDELIQLMDMLTGQQPELQIVPIVGMGGIGKTTLTRSIYENPLIVEHFDIRAWVTISQNYSVKKILSELRSCFGAIDRDGLETEDQLRLKLYQTLSGRRFLIVLDDMWSIETWDTIKFIFPDNDYRSRVVITTRISNVANYLSSSSFEMNFLDEDKSWKLFCGKVFLEEGCPLELEVVGRKIVRECKGLPLSIAVIGGLLRNSRGTREYWEYFARDLNSILMLGNDEYCLKILSLSYNHLPAPLKPCFLYMGVFREDVKIRASELIKLFVAEGFLKSEKGQILEEVAEGYLKDLVDRNLILVDSLKWNGSIKYCKMHDLIREVCLKIGEREKFLHAMRMLDIPPSIDRERCIAYYGTIPLSKEWPKVSDALPSAPLARTFKSDGGPLPLKCRLLRVLSHADFESMKAIFQQVNLRYLTCEVLWSLKPWQFSSKLHQYLYSGMCKR